MKIDEVSDGDEEVKADMRREMSKTAEMNSAEMERKKLT